MEETHKNKNTDPSAPSDSSSSSSLNADNSPSNSTKNPSSTKQQPPRPPQLPLKIPPPPSEHPPPYTPFGGQAQNSTLLANASSSQGNANTNRRIVRPPGFRNYLTTRNLLIVFGIILAIILFKIFVYVIYKSNESDEDLNTHKALEDDHKPLVFSHIGLGAVKGNRDWISFDEQNNDVIISVFDSDEQMLESETINVDEYLDGFKFNKFHVSSVEEHIGDIAPTKFRNCIRFTPHLVCCSSQGNGHMHLTKCFLETKDNIQISAASFYDFVPRWQTLVDGEALLLLHNTKKHAILDLKRNILHDIREEHLPNNFISHGFFFPKATANELIKLVRVGEHFRLCEFVQTRDELNPTQGFYSPKEGKCQNTPFKIDPELSQIIFCVNSLYSAIVQYDQLPDDASNLTWRVWLQFDGSDIVYSAGASAPSRQRQIALNCADDRLELFVLGDNELHKFITKLNGLK